jgi:hypothetical protein
MFALDISPREAPKKLFIHKKEIFQLTWFLQENILINHEASDDEK